MAVAANCRRIMGKPDVMPEGIRLYQNPWLHSPPPTLKPFDLGPRKSWTEAVPELIDFGSKPARIRCPVALDDNEIQCRSPASFSPTDL